VGRLSAEICHPEGFSEKLPAEKLLARIFLSGKFSAAIGVSSNILRER
jgi:hypothetical protein